MVRYMDNTPRPRKVAVGIGANRTARAIGEVLA